MPMPRDNETRFLAEVLQGNTEAMRLCQVVFRISQTFDDLHDQDKAVTPAQVQRLLWECIEELPTNAFYQRHFTRLQPVLRASVLDWMDSCALEQSSLHGKTIAFVLRDSVGALVSHCAYLIGGFDYMQQVAPAIRMHIFEETLDEYVEGLDPQSSDAGDAGEEQAQ